MRHLKFKRKVFAEAALTSNLIYQIGELPALRQKSATVKPAEINSIEIKTVINKLKSRLKEYRKLTGKGRGIAAIQIGISLKMAVVFLEKKIITIINPRITLKSETLLRYPEICMSANPIIAKVVRPSYIEFEYLGENGQRKFWNNHQDKLMNRVFQHEIDHMEGIINIDLVDSKDLIILSDPNFFKNAKFEEVREWQNLRDKSLKQNLLDELREKERQDPDLPLKESATNLVFGHGNPDAKVLFLGEAPGRFEDEKGLPFIGAAGKVLDQLLDSINLKRADVFISSVLHYRPPKNRQPKPSEIEAFSKYVDQIIEIIDPKVIATLGNFSLKKFLPNAKISAVHGKPHTLNWKRKEITVIPLYHPAAVLYKRDLQKTLEADFKEISKLIK